MRSVRVLPAMLRSARTLTRGTVSALLLAGCGAGLAAQNLPPNKPGFPITLNGHGTLVGSQPLIANLGLSTDGTKQIIFGTNKGELHVIYKNGSGVWGEAPGFPVTLGGPINSSPAVGDLEGNGIPVIVCGYGTASDLSKPGGVKAFRRDGTLLWSFLTFQYIGTGGSDPVVGTPAIGDVDGDGHLEVVFGALDFRLYVLDGATGLTKPGWPKFMRDSIWSSPVLHDIDGDGRPDIVVGVDAHQEGPPFNTPAGGCLHVLRFDSTQTCPDSNPADCGPPSEVAGFPVCVDQVIYNSPAIGDIDGDGKPEIVHGTGTFYSNRGHKIYAWHCNGTPVAGWPVSIDGQSGTFNGPALADVNGDGKLDVVVTDDNTGPSNTFHVYAFKGDGTQLWAAVPKEFFGATLSAGPPIVADVLGDGIDILVPTNTSVAVFSHTGALLSDGGTHPPGAYAFYTPTSLSGVAVGDLEDPAAPGAKIEVVAVSAADFPSANNTMVNVWNPFSGSSTPPWGQFHQGVQRLGVVPGTPGCSGGCTVATSGLKFFTVAPCRVADTRNPNGPQGGPALSQGVQRVFPVGGFCGVPTAARAVSFNVTVTGPSGGGVLRFGPGTCNNLPLTSTINFSTGQTRANNAVLSLATDGSGGLAVLPTIGGGGTVQLIIDVNGYFN
jgi:hypothetical protein